MPRRPARAFAVTSKHLAEDAVHLVRNATSSTASRQGITVGARIEEGRERASFLSQSASAIENNEPDLVLAQAECQRARYYADR